ncbi:MAG: hypothetical protein IPL84_14320 [Chitinophagaceae bacterium]|nr:hypothetical protein [Chitinophagaceae bacterium]
MNKIKIAVLFSAAVLLSTGMFAQRGNNRNNSRHSGQYNSGRHYGNYNNHVSIRVMPRYNYRTVYRPVYRPYYRPTPVYRPVVRSVYRSPRAYVHFGPVFGFRINVLPFGYSQIYVGSNPYYYNNGVYYRPYNTGGYEVVAPPLNATVNKLPSDARVTVIDGQKYYQVGGTFYQEEITENNKLRYRVAGTDGVLNTGAADEEVINTVEDNIPVLGSRYDVLPEDSKMQLINQQKYFVSPNGIYYKEVIEGDQLRYEVTTVE